MPTCPVCRIEYAPGVEFCSKDGARLIPDAVASAPAAPPAASPGTSPVVVALLTVGGIAVVALAAWLGWAYFQPTSTAPEAIQPRLAEARPSPPPSSPPPGMRSAPTGPSTESVDETDSPWDEPEEDEAVIAPDAVPSEYSPFDAPITAYANTEDGSRVVLRSAPTTEYGRRVARIPNESEVEVLGCLDDLEETDGRTSSWCRVRYDGTSGWAFAAFLTTTPPTPVAP
ncbi:MAG: hypothetical protein Rubg2KO_38270 [Rubricoccaceae bacterium]